MKQNGKFTKKTKQPQVKSLLLQTYFTSLLCLVLSVSMFFGTSYAWFTSEVNSTNNEIYVGTLKVDLFKTVKGPEGPMELDLSEAGNKLFDGSDRWEPGYTALEKIRVVNKGDLAFNYVMNFTEGKLKEGEKKSLEEVARYFEVWIYDHAANTQRVFTTPASYKDIKEVNGWESLGTLDKLLAGKTVLSGELNTNDQVKSLKEAGKTGASEHIYTIALHMREDATPDVMGHKIGLSVKLVAYQKTFEKDDLGNTNYDDIAAISNEEDLKKALDNADNILMTSNITIDDVSKRGVMRGGVLDGNGHTIKYVGGKQGDSSVGVLTTNGGTISNLTVEGGDNGRALYITDLTSNLVVSGCNLSGAYAFNLNSANVTDYTITFMDTNFYSWTSYANVAEHVYFTDCTFAANLRPYGGATLTECTFSGNVLDLSELQSGETITLINCTYNGVKIEKATLTGSKIEGTDALKIEAGMVVLKTN